jgi:integrase
VPKRRANNEGTIYRRQDGRWCASVTLPGGRRKSYYGQTRQEVAQKLTQGLTAVQHGLPVPKERLTVQAYMLDWLQGMAARVRLTTHVRYERVIRRHILPTLGPQSLARLGPEHLHKLYADLLEHGLTAAGVRLAHAVLSRGLRDAYRFGLVARQVTTLVTPPRIPRHAMLVMTAPEARRFLEITKGTRYHALFVLALSTGMRQGELLALRWQDVDLDRGVVRIQQAVARVHGTLTVSEPKTARGRRQIALTPQAIQALRHHRSQQAAERLRLGPVWHDQGLIFCSLVGTFLDPAHLTTRVFQPLLRRAALPHMRFHDLRHTAATLLLAEGVHAKVVSEMLGHATIGLTLDLYSHVLPDMQSAAALAMERVLGTVL